jgi:hypothetical protein
MDVPNERLISQYDLALQKMQDALQGRDQATVNVLQNWREGLSCVSDQNGLKAHAARTMRTFGSMKLQGFFDCGCRSHGAIHNPRSG